MTQPHSIILERAPVAAVEEGLTVARVTQAEPLLLSSASRTVAGTRAFSCLIAPAEGDSVLVAEIDGAAVVLAVLKRPGLGDATLSVPDAAGAITVRAQALNLEAATSIAVRAPNITMTGTGMRFVADTIGWLGRSLSVVAERLHRSVDRDETIARQIATRAAHRTTVVDAVDTEKVGTKMTSVDTVATTTAEAAVIFTREDLRLDGKRITMG